MLHWGVLIKKNRSTIEFCENKKDCNKYDLGLKANFIQTFGINPLMWFIPFGTQDDVDGLDY